jgi:hypothetical protein
MYDGYLIKINGVTLPNRYIDRSSWRCTPQAKRVVDSFYDVEGVYHEYLADHQRSTIQFTLNEHKDADHAYLNGFLAQKTNVAVEYYDDGTGTYATGTFRIADVEYKQKKTFDSTVWYDKTTVKLTEY